MAARAGLSDMSYEAILPIIDFITGTYNNLYNEVYYADAGQLHQVQPV